MTVCEKCGTTRDCIDAACSSCQFQPTSVRDLATAVLLTARFEASAESFGTDPLALDDIAQSLRAGIRPTLDEAELLRHEDAVAEFRQVTPVQLVRGILTIFQPAILVIAALLVVLFVTRFFVH